MKTSLKDEMKKAKIDALALEIMKEFEGDNDGLTLEEAREMAEWELKEKANRRYEKSDTPKKKAEKVRKVDETKKKFINGFRVYLEGCGCKVDPLKNETDLHFSFENENYSVKLTKHRAPK